MIHILYMKKNEVKRMKKEIIAKSNKIFINGEDK